MTAEYRCPEDIVRLFDDLATIHNGRCRAIQWLETYIGLIPDGAIVWMPDPSSGEMQSFTKGPLFQ